MRKLRSGNLILRRNISINMKAGILLLFLCAAAGAQVYPPGRYPPGSYPGQTPYPGQSPYPGGRQPTGSGIPLPGRKSKDPKASDSKNGQPMPNFRGKLKHMDEKALSVELGDNRVLDFKRTGQTKFFKNGDETKTPKFSEGDQVSVEAQEDPGGFLNAVNVYWEKGAGAAGTSKSDDGVVDTWKDTPNDTAKTTPKDTPAAGSEHATERTPPPLPPDPSDPGPPKLKRGGPADPSRQRAADLPPEAVATLPPPTPERPAGDRPSIERPTIARGDGDEDSVRLVVRKDEPLIRRAADAALDFTETLPSYVCQEMMSRFQSETHPPDFRPIDVVSAEVVYENGREDYRNITINGKPVKKKIEDTGGAWSTGEFGTVLIDLFSPATAADFHFRRDSRAGGVMAKMYDFTVLRERSHWSIHSGSQTYQPAYSGSVWIDPQNARVLRIEMEAKSMPAEFPLDHVESATDYQNIRLGDAQQYLLPVHSETLSCQRGTNYCSRNVIDFRNYHKYTGESSIKFGGDVKDVKPDKKDK